MRDATSLRTTIALLACLPSLAATTIACSPGVEPQPVAKDDAADQRKRPMSERGGRSAEIKLDGQRQELVIDDKRVAYYEKKAKKEGKTLEEVVPPAQLAAVKQQLEKREGKQQAAAAAVDNPPEPAEVAEPIGPFPGDPPYIDGYNPEEETCPTGNWCGTVAQASGVAVPNIPAVMDCPSKIGGGKGSELIKNDAKAYEGLSAAPNMQGTLNEHGTELARARTGNDQMCCYHWFEYCSGRPHLGHDGPVLADVESGDGWDEPTLAAAAAPHELPAALRQRIAEQWLADARAEHASIAAFARATLELMAVGAPPTLLADAQRAGLDEIDHAQRCFALAGRYGGESVQPGSLPALAPREADLARLAADTFAEGCVGETIAALAAQRAARRCVDPSVAQSLRQIADDEARHAALAWSTVAWAVQRGGAPVLARLSEVAATLAQVGTDAPARDPDADVLAAHGRLDAQAQAQAARDAWQDVIAPMLAGLQSQPAEAVAAFA